MAAEAMLDHIKSLVEKNNGEVTELEEEEQDNPLVGPISPFVIELRDGIGVVALAMLDHIKSGGGEQWGGNCA